MNLRTLLRTRNVIYFLFVPLVPLDLKIFSNNQLSIQDKIMRFEIVKILMYAVEYILMVLHYPKGCGPHVTIMIVAFLSRETAKSRKVVVCMRTVENG